MDSDTNGTENLPEVRNKADLDLPVWDRQGDMVMQFASDLETRWRVAKMLAKSGMVRQKKPEAIMAIGLKAFEMGVPLMQALGSMYFIDGNVGLEGHLMDALAIDRCGVTKTVHEQSMDRCKLTLHREGWDDLDVEYSMEDARRAGMVRGITDDGEIQSSKSNWRQHPKAMLYWRALSKGLKQIAPDYFGGVYHQDELEDLVRQGRAADRVSTNEELDALEDGVEPEEEPMDEDEIDQLRDELSKAVKAGVIENKRKAEILSMAVEGRFDECREAREGVRADMLHAEDAAEQGSLV